MLVGIVLVLAWAAAMGWAVVVAVAVAWWWHHAARMLLRGTCSSSRTRPKACSPCPSAVASPTHLLQRGRIGTQGKGSNVVYKPINCC